MKEAKGEHRLMPLVDKLAERKRGSCFCGVVCVVVLLGKADG